MASVGVGIFNTWLSEKLLKLNSDVDLDVFVSYITGILETETTRDDKNESLVGIIGEILPDNSIAEHCDEIIDKWAELTNNCNELKSESGSSSLDAAIHKMIEKQTTTTATAAAVNRSQQTASDEHCKRAILAQYANVSDGEGSDDGAVDTLVHTKPAAVAAAATWSTGDLLVKNMNALKVKERELQERNEAKQQSDTKRQKDKEDREKQKQKTQDRKENEKKRTQKGEKKR